MRQGALIDKTLSTVRMGGTNIFFFWRNMELSCEEKSQGRRLLVGINFFLAFVPQLLKIQRSPMVSLVLFYFKEEVSDHMKAEIHLCSLIIWRYSRNC